jgi:transposase
VWAVAMDNETYDSIATAILKIFAHMEKPKIFQDDQKIIEAFEKFLSPYNFGITLVMTKPHETNKNAIVERVIKTLKNDLLKYLYFNPFPIASGQLDTTSQVLQEVCSLRNHTVHRMIEEKPIDVFYGREPNRQIIVRKKYPQYKQRDLVLIKPIRERGLIKKKIFEFDYDIYIILAKEGDKYKIKSLYNFVHEINKVKKRWYKPYELTLSLLDKLSNT